VATDWGRVAQELPFVGRAAERGDHLGSRVIAARLVAVAMHLAHLLERRWPPYAKWTGTNLARLPHAQVITEPLLETPEAQNGRSREEGLVIALGPSIACSATSVYLRSLTPSNPSSAGPTAASATTLWSGSRTQSPTRQCVPYGAGSAQSNNGATTSTSSLTPQGVYRRIPTGKRPTSRSNKKVVVFGPALHVICP
jgi:hypothetical protein